jgi:hypothetical protein
MKRWLPILTILFASGCGQTANRSGTAARDCVGDDCVATCEASTCVAADGSTPPGDTGPGDRGSGGAGTQDSSAGGGPSVDSGGGPFVDLDAATDGRWQLPDLGPICTTPPGIGNVGACVRSAEGSDGLNREYSVSGTVTEILSGGFTCDWTGHQTDWTVRIADAETMLDVSGLPGSQPIIDIGQVVTVTFFYHYPAPWVEDAESATTIRGDDGSLLYWTATAPQLSSVTAPDELQLGEPQPLCSGGPYPCDHTQHYQMEISIGAEAATLTPGETRQLGDFVVTLGDLHEYVRYFPEPYACQGQTWGGGGSRASLSVVRGDAATLFGHPLP